MDTYDRAVAAHRAGDTAAAERLFRSAAAMCLVNLAFLKGNAEAFAEAESFYRDALRVDPTDSEAAYSLSLLMLSQGRYAEAWPLYEHRRMLTRIYKPPIRAHVPEWRGEPLAGKSIAVLGEQGQGDQIMFGRFLRDLEERGALVRYFCAPTVAPLFPGASSTLPPDLLAQHDYWIYAGSLPYRLGITLANLTPPKDISAVAPRSGAVGVMTHGNPAFANDINRSLDPASAAVLRRLGLDLHPEATGAQTFADTAEIIAGLELVITVDTAVAHLAASMGKPTWILLPRIGTDWRWLRDRTDSPWYPTARLFRQPTRGDWNSVVVDVRDALACDHGIRSKATMAK